MAIVRPGMVSTSLVKHSDCSMLHADKKKGDWEEDPKASTVMGVPVNAQRVYPSS